MKNKHEILTLMNKLKHDIISLTSFKTMTSDQWFPFEKYGKRVMTESKFGSERL